MIPPMNKPPTPWPFTGGWPKDKRRQFPDGSELRVIHIHPKWADLMWFDPTRKLEVYLSTLPFDKYQNIDMVTI